MDDRIKEFEQEIHWIINENKNLLDAVVRLVSDRRWYFSDSLIASV